MPIKGATSYQVTVRGLNLSWTTNVTSGTEIVYPKNAGDLVPGKAYKLVVEADGRSSTEEPEPGLGFILLKSDELKMLKDAVRNIGELDLEEVSKKLCQKAKTNFLCSCELLVKVY